VDSLNVAVMRLGGRPQYFSTVLFRIQQNICHLILDRRITRSIICGNTTDCG
jgi:hypothetical protein